MTSSSKQVENTIRRHLDEHKIWQNLATDSPEIYAAVERALLAPGKRLRPRLFMLTAAGYGMSAPQVTRQVALALELAHAFVLMHDDLIDKASERRGLPTIGRDLDTIWSGNAASSFSGNDVALVLGDLLYTLAIEALSDVKVTREKSAAAIDLFTGAAQETARGALREIIAARADPEQLCMADLHETYRLKTAIYTFELPMQLGALFADKETEYVEAIETFATEAGLAFQLCNDFEPLQTWLAGGKVPDDVREARMTVALMHVWENSSAEERVSLMSGCEKTTRQLFINNRTLEWLAADISSHLERARRLVAPLGLNTKATISLLELLDSLQPDVAP